MNIGFDAKRLFNNSTGLGNYSRTLVRNLQLYFPEHNYHLYTDRIRENDDTRYFLNKDKFTIHTGPKYFKSIWRSKFLVNDLIRDNIHLYHGLSNELPYGIHKSNVKSIVTIHDLIFEVYPRQYKLFDRKIYHLKSKYAVDKADKVLSISQATKNDILRFYKPDKDSIEVIYQACGSTFIEGDDLQLDLEPPYTIPSKYYLYVGSIIERKGLMNIAKAIAMMPAKDRHPIVVVGKGTRYLNTVNDYIKGEGISNLFYFLKGVSNMDLREIYRNAQALIYPSIIEGFGIPLIEAGLMDTPIISSNRSSLPEAGGPDIIQIDPESPADIASAIISIENGVYPIERCLKVSRYIKDNFDEKKLTEQLIELYKELV